MGVSTLSAATHITPVVIKTFLAHSKNKAHRIKQGEEDTEPQHDIFFDEAFHIVKAFIDLGVNNTVESLQNFTNSHVPSPYWAAVSPVLIPLSTCNKAADALIEWFDPDELDKVVGGERWWQVRGLDGVDGEWITETEYLSKFHAPSPSGKKLSEEEQNILQMEHLDTVMLYVHGGGYFWGSINTHRYQIIRYARKIKGRAFAVNYRKAPQYPWPCPLQDVIAAYLYLIDPPPGALHKPIRPDKIVFAGDSAGAGLSLTALTVLRDLGLPMPAGAVLISPWVDLTHSFPSIITNTNTDIIPEHGFLAKPSALWPVELLPPKGGRITKATSHPPPEPGHADTLQPSAERVESDLKRDGSPDKVETQGEMLESYPGSSEASSSSDTTKGKSREKPDDDDFEKWEPLAPKILMEDMDAVPLEMRAQIQMYATTEQLTHPLVSPVLQGSLGNLPPLYIIAGDGEVLRDEIVYMAHRAAHPEEYPTRKGVLKRANRQQENAEKFTKPTKVHLQVFDGQCHVLTVFTFTKTAKYAYRSIAEFVKHVTTHDAAHLERNPFPELHRPPPHADSGSWEEEDLDTMGRKTRKKAMAKDKAASASAKSSPRPLTEDHPGAHNGSDVKIYTQAVRDTADEVAADNAAVDKLPEAPKDDYANGHSILSESRDIKGVGMLRERVDIHGVVRPMEAREELSVLQLPLNTVGIIKEGPAMKWYKGQQEWDKKFKSNAEKAVKQREKVEKKVEKLIQSARDQGFLMVGETPNEKDEEDRNLKDAPRKGLDSQEEKGEGIIQNDRRWGPLDLDHENPPASAIAGRRDTVDSLALIKKSIYHTAPKTHQNVPKLKPADVLRAAFDPHDDPNRPPRQGPSEQQKKTQPMHGMKIWEGLIRYFMREKSKRAGETVAKAVKSKVGSES